MDHSMLVLFYIFIGPFTAADSSLSPRDLQCVFFAYVNVTCSWKPAENAGPDTHYTLQVNQTGVAGISECHSSHLQCFVTIGSLNRDYCMWVFAQSDQQPAVSSDTLCLNGYDAAKLPGPDQFWVSSVRGRPRCLRLKWTVPANFPLLYKNIRDGSLLNELQYSTTHQAAWLSVDVDLREEVQCVFSPCTQYSVRIRYRYKHSLSHWSPWSPTASHHTHPEAPSSAPQLWRRVQPADGAGFRRVTLLWKGSVQEEAACSDIWLGVRCRLEDSQADVDVGDCTDLTLTNSSCQLTAPPHTFICTLNMSNSAGSAPLANITIPSQWQTDQRSVESINVTSLDDFSVDVQWAALKLPNITGFVVEWCITAESLQCQTEPHWYRVNHNTSRTNITGFQPNISYFVSVRAVYGAVSGPGLTVLAYSRQAAPSVGPKLYVKEHGCVYVTVSWSPVPLLLQNGFITKYTLYYESEDNVTRYNLVDVNSEQFNLLGVSGLYRFYMKAHTAAGSGPAGPVLSVPIDSCMFLLTAMLIGLGFLAGSLILISVCWKMRQRIKQSIWPKIPDPAQAAFLTGSISVHSDPVLTVQQ